MFGIFKKKSKIELLGEKYRQLEAEAFKLSTSNRAQSDRKKAEAEEILKQIEALQNQARS